MVQVNVYYLAATKIVGKSMRVRMSSLKRGGEIKREAHVLTPLISRASHVVCVYD
jgi:hypothetical protein